MLLSDIRNCYVFTGLATIVSELPKHAYAELEFVKSIYYYCLYWVSW